MRRLRPAPELQPGARVRLRLRIRLASAAVGSGGRAAAVTSRRSVPGTPILPEQTGHKLASAPQTVVTSSVASRSQQNPHGGITRTNFT